MKQTTSIIVLLILFSVVINGYNLENLLMPLKSYKNINLFRNQTNISCTEDCCVSLKNRPSMNYTFYQNTGRFKGGKDQYQINQLAYSGQGNGYLNPVFQCVSNIGPLPASTYQINFCKNVMHETVQRPCSFYLDPLKPLEMCGRSDFFIHGCACCTPGDDTNPPSPGCSAGCIVLSYINRKKLRLGDIIIVQHYEPKQQQ